VSTLTLDLGTSATKATLWSGAELISVARAPIPTEHPRPGWAEQDPQCWWRSVVDACGEVRARAPAVYDGVDAVGFSAARETFALFDVDLAPLGPGVLWSDRRAQESVDALGDPAGFRARTGVVLNAACCAAKLWWVATYARDSFDAARWVLAPRDWIVARLTGEVVTEPTLESRTGLSDLDGGRTGPVTARMGDRLPPAIATTATLPVRGGDDVAALALRPGVRVVPGGGDRACEVLGTGADAATPMVSWGTTTNVSVPHPGPAAVLPGTAAVSRGALEGFVVEAGLSASGSALAWLARLTGRDHGDLLALAGRGSEPGARGVVALPWLNGARAPFWRADANAAFLGLSSAHDVADLSRAVVEAVACDVTRCVELLAPDARAIALAGGGTADDLWRAVVTAATARDAIRRRHDESASVGARMIIAAALEEDLELDDVNPVREVTAPEPSLVDALARVRARSDRAAEAVLDLDLS
jgi:sugar (pentulose or hexulose) kinase